MTTSFSLEAFSGASFFAAASSSLNGRSSPWWRSSTKVVFLVEVTVLKVSWISVWIIWVETSYIACEEEEEDEDELVEVVLDDEGEEDDEDEVVEVVLDDDDDNEEEGKE